MINKQNFIISKDPYIFDLDKNGFPTFTSKNIRFMQNIINNDSNYRISFDGNAENSTASFLKNHFPETKLELKKAVELVNKENSTHLYVKDGFNATIKKLCEIGIDELKSKIENGKPEIVNHIALAVPSRINFSFASKFCTYCNRYCFDKDDYSI